MEDQLCEKWEVEVRLKDLSWLLRGSRNSEREKGVSKYYSTVMGQVLCSKIDVTILIFEIRKLGL